MADFTPEQISAAIARAADFIENADGNVCLDPGEDERIIAALRTHHATLADMAKRLEAAERDAPALTDAQCDAIYSALDDYGREVDHFEFGLPWHCDGGPEKRREVIRAAIDATQEGEG